MDKNSNFQPEDTEKLSHETHEWYKIKQNHNIGYSLMFFLLNNVPPIVMRIVSFPVGFFYWFFGKSIRKVSKSYLQHFSGYEFLKAGKTRKRSTLKHVVSFALNLVETVQSWGGKFSFSNVRWQGEDVKALVDDIECGRGAVLVISHLGNAQMMRGLAAIGESGTKRTTSITTIIDENVSEGFWALLQKVNPDFSLRTINSNDIGPETVFVLLERLSKGELVVIAGDRIGAYSGRTIEMDFLGAPARIPYGVFVLLSILNVPAFFMNGLRRRDFGLDAGYDMYVKKNDVDFNCSRKEREERIIQSAQNYVKNLEQLCMKHPYQWYNFYEFWDEK